MFRAREEVWLVMVLKLDLCSQLLHQKSVNLLTLQPYLEGRTDWLEKLCKTPFYKALNIRKQTPGLFHFRMGKEQGIKQNVPTAKD